MSSVRYENDRERSLIDVIDSFGSEVVGNICEPAQFLRREIDRRCCSKEGQSFIAASVYQAKLAGYCHNVTVVWSKTLINHSVLITIENHRRDHRCTCKIDPKPWPFWSKKGLESLEVDDRRVDIYWDLRSAKFSGGSAPTSDYYMALVREDEVSLLLGDYKKEAFKRTKARPRLVDATVVSKRKNVFGKKCFSARGKFEARRKEHDIVVENSISGPKDPEMWISIDGLALPVQVFWDVHDWLFCSPGTGRPRFIHIQVQSIGILVR